MKGLAWGLLYTALAGVLLNYAGFAWLLDLSEAWQWLSSIGTAALGVSAVSALFSYKGQKELDHEFAVSKQRLKIYGQFTAAVEHYFQDLVEENLRDKVDKDEYRKPRLSYTTLEQTKALLVQFASEEVLVEASRLLQHLKDFHNAVANYRACSIDNAKKSRLLSDEAYTKCVGAFVDLVKQIRRETSGHKEIDQASEEILKKLYRFPERKEETQ